MADDVGAPNAGRAFALVMVDELARHGVSDAVLAPGSRSTPIALALDEHPDIRLHVRIDERSAAYLAVGLIRATGRPVPILCTSGTATSYFLGAVMEADQARLPLLVLTADRPPELRGIGANQTVDQVGMFGTAVRWAADVGVPESRPDSVRYWRSLVSQAVERCEARSGALPGPVHLNLPLREPLAPVDDGVGFPYPLDGRDGNKPWTRSPARNRGEDSRLEPGDLTMIRDARRGVVIAGDVGGLGRTVARFAAGAGWPLIAEPHSGARLGPAALASIDAVLRDVGFAASHEPDLVVVCGRVGLSRALTEWLSRVPHVLLGDAGSWRDVTRTARAVLGDLIGLDLLHPLPADSSWLTEWKAVSDAAGGAIDAELDAAEVLTEPRVARDVAALIPDDAALVVASSMPIRDLDLTMRPRDLTIHANRGVSGIDGFVSTALGVALGHDGPTYALTGDLSLLHDVNGLLPGPDPRPDITFVVINNDGGGIFSTLPTQTDDPARFERLFGTAHGVDLGRLAAAYDVRHRLVTTAAELADALSSYGGVRIIEIRTDRAGNAALHRRLRDVAAAAVTAAGSGS